MPPEPEIPDYEKMTDEQLEAAFDAPDVPTPSPEPEPEDVLPEPEPEPETKPEPEAKPKDEAVAEPAVEAEPDLAALEMQELRLRLDKLQADRDRFEFVAGRNAGQVGHLKKQLEELSQPRERDVDEQEDSEEPTPQTRRSASNRALEDKVAELQASESSRAIEGVYSEFIAQVASDLKSQGIADDKIDSERNAIMSRIATKLKDHFEPFGPLNSFNAKALRKVTGMALQSAYADHKLEQIAVLRKAASERKASQVSASKIVKQAASPSGGGITPKPKPKHVSDMTAEEADAAMIAEYGDGRRPRR